jgi:hypothetical protein
LSPRELVNSAGKIRAFRKISLIPFISKTPPFARLTQPPGKALQKINGTEREGQLKQIDFPKFPQPDKFRKLTLWTPLCVNVVITIDECFAGVCRRSAEQELKDF